MTHIWRAAPLIVTGAATAWLAPTSGWFVIAVQVVTVLVIAGNMTYVWKTMPLLAAGAGAAWLLPTQSWFVVVAQVITVLVIAFGAMVRRWNAD